MRAGNQDVGRMEFLLTLRKRGITDQAVLRAMEEVPRSEFVQPDYTNLAYSDHALPIACGQTISQPYVVAYMTEQLGLKREHRILEVGTGSGYQAAVLSRLAREVVSIERFRTLADTARERLRRLGYDNVEVECAGRRLRFADLVDDGSVRDIAHDRQPTHCWDEIMQQSEALAGTTNHLQ